LGLRPWPAGLDAQLPTAGAAEEPPVRVQDLVAQRFRRGFGELAVQRDEPRPGRRRRGDQRSVHPVGGVDVGRVGAPALVEVARYAAARTERRYLAVDPEADQRLHGRLRARHAPDPRALGKPHVRIERGRGTRAASRQRCTNCQ